MMREFNFRHALIADGKTVKGLVSLRDLLLRYVSQKDIENRRLAV
jgi:hypothetical protein